jgi:hypothetical protein
MKATPGVDPREGVVTALHSEGGDPDDGVTAELENRLNINPVLVYLGPPPPTPPLTHPHPTHTSTPFPPTHTPTLYCDT